VVNRFHLWGARSKAIGMSHMHFAYTCTRFCVLFGAFLIKIHKAMGNKDSNKMSNGRDDNDKLQQRKCNN